MIKIALVGCGAISQEHHLPNIDRSKKMELYCCCDIDEACAEATAKSWGASKFETDWRKVLEDHNVDMVLLATHTELRADLIHAAIDKKIPVYTEKPLTNNHEEILPLCEHAAANQVPVCVGYNRRSSPAFIKIEEMLTEAKAYGARDKTCFQRPGADSAQPQQLKETQMLIRVNDDFRTWKSWSLNDSQGVFYNCTGHMLDVAMNLIAKDPVEVYATGSHHGNFTQIVKFADNSIVTLQYTIIGNFDFPKELYEISHRNVFISLNNFLEIEQKGLVDFPEKIEFPIDCGQELTSHQGLTAYKEAVTRFSAPGFDKSKVKYSYIFPDKGHFRHLERFADHCIGKGPNPFPIHDAYKLTVLLKHLQASRQSGQAVKISKNTINFT